MALSYTQAQLDALRAAVASGTRRVSYDGRTVEYASTDEMLKLIAVIERAISPNRSRISYPSFRRID